ncbi:cyclase family protein [Candidatus Woesebacteria bacterium]|nr:cyclase family protein [Candidatus Woesebacteria bacterium]
MTDYATIIDISLPLHPGTIVYPSNPAIEIEKETSASGNTISKITFGSHTGTHIDAPRHSSVDGIPLDQIPLSTFVGMCRVIDCTSEQTFISQSFLESQNIQTKERILLKTSNSTRGFETFYDDYVFLSPEGARYLAEKGVQLVGIDYLSIKQRGSKDNRPHTELLSKNIPIVEGIDLRKVDAGDYFLVILPLYFTDIDGAPARAILLK